MFYVQFVSFSKKRPRPTNPKVSMEKLLKNPYTALCHGYHTRVHRKIRKPKQSFGRLYFAMRRRDLKAAGAKPTAVAVVAEAGS
ncbi:MAG: hypothetical protein A2571_01760 [Candidatus Vogelbacteria bacterium RIFOXYD1_FULL_44_32]|uniref:Uncharacterized protein n=1 Tax=Candidatus Vogelbacteria bacterium RIFOXYD1_FULL_44_32 TaxID=1802438 RepID=A0A1G2QD21_9BACT|nr:MAG: hypothetical protein A2571_01760 [Candidatus Vogelbacteria bacterium RIFOXYD1_FULL_44_32]